MTVVQKVGELIERITTAVKQRGLTPHSSIVVRLGDEGEELQIEHVKVRPSVIGPPVIILQVKTRE